MVFSTNPGNCDCCDSGCEISRPSHPCWDLPLSTVVLLRVTGGPCNSAPMNTTKVLFRDPDADIYGEEGSEDEGELLEIAYVREDNGDGVTCLATFSVDSPHRMMRARMDYPAGPNLAEYEASDDTHLESTADNTCDCNFSIICRLYARLLHSSEYNVGAGTPAMSVAVSGYVDGTCNQCATTFNKTHSSPLSSVSVVGDGYAAPVWQGMLAATPFGCGGGNISFSCNTTNFKTSCPEPDNTLNTLINARLQYSGGGVADRPYYDDKDPRDPLTDGMFGVEQHSGTSHAGCNAAGQAYTISE